jgi:16S rRNA (cytosine967-C5)-methyltransferase
MSEVHAPVRAVLRLGAYQLLHLERIPGHAIVNEAVASAKALGHIRAAGFVNAVLRKLATSRRSPLPRRPTDARNRQQALRYLSITLSHPDWLVARWLDRYGLEATEAWCRFNNEPAEMAVRPWPGGSSDALVAQLHAAGLEARKGAFVRDAVRLPPGSLGRLDALTRGALFIQDEASQLVAHSVGARPGDRVLDVCAAPGGKTLILCDEMEGRGLLVAGDSRPTRIALLERTLARATAPVHLLALDAKAGLPFGPVFDRVLVDAPCSGLGTLRRDPDLKWSRTEADLTRLALDERRILTNAAAVVRSGGLLTYATCSGEPEEDEAVVETFLSGHAEFTVTPPAASAALPDLGRVVDARGFIRTLPFRDGLDAYFVASLRRKGLACL